MMGDHYYDPDPHHPHSNLCQEWQLLCLAQCPIWRGKQLPSTITDPVIYLSINLSVSSVHHKRGRNEGGWRDLVWIEGIEWILRNAVRTYISLMCVCVCVCVWVGGCVTDDLCWIHTAQCSSLYCVCVYSLADGSLLMIQELKLPLAKQRRNEEGRRMGRQHRKGGRWWEMCADGCTVPNHQHAAPHLISQPPIAGAPSGLFA